MDTRAAVIYIASGAKYIKEAEVSARSIGGQYPCILCTPDDVGMTSPFERVLHLPPRQFAYWYLDEVNYLNLAFEQLVEYDRFLLLDTDTYVCSSDLSDFFTILEIFDIAGTHAIARETQNVREDIPASFPELHVGAISFRRSKAVDRLLTSWLEIFQSNPGFYKDNDQGPLREALWQSQDIKLAILPNEYCFRFRWGGLVGRPVKVLHGRENGASYEKIVKEINSNRGIRVFSRRELA